MGDREERHLQIDHVSWHSRFRKERLGIILGAFRKIRLAPLCIVDINNTGVSEYSINIGLVDHGKCKKELGLLSDPSLDSFSCTLVDFPDSDGTTGWTKSKIYSISDP